MDEKERVFDRDIDVVDKGMYVYFSPIMFLILTNMNKYTKCIAEHVLIMVFNLTNQVRCHFLKTNVLIHSLAFTIITVVIPKLAVPTIPDVLRLWPNGTIVKQIARSN